MASLAAESLPAFQYLRATGRFAALRSAFGDAVQGARPMGVKCFTAASGHPSDPRHIA
jgi:hypothetical protein